MSNRESGVKVRRPVILTVVWAWLAVGGIACAAPDSYFDKLDAEERCVLSYAAFGHSNKDMAYELGCSINAVSATLSRGLRKLGLRSRAELAVVFGAQLFPPRSSKSG